MNDSLKNYLFAVAITFIALVVAYGIAYNYVIDLGDPFDGLFLSGFQSGEDAIQFHYRWSSSNSTLLFPAVAQNENYQLVLRLAAGPRPPTAEDPDLQVIANGKLLQMIAVAPDLKQYQVAIPAPNFSSPDILIELRVPTFNPSRDIPGSSDNRNLGITVDWARLQPAETGIGRIDFPHPLYVLGWLLNGALVFSILLQTRFARQRWSLWLAFLVFNGALIGALVFARAYVSVYVWSGAVVLALTSHALHQIPGWIAKARARQPFTLDFIHTLGIANARWRGLFEFVFIAAMGVYFFFNAVWPLRTHSLPDFISYYVGGALWWQGLDYYDPVALQHFNARAGLLSGVVPAFLYPPFAAVSFAPLALLPIADAKIVWLVMNLAFLVGGGLLLVSYLQSASRNAASPIWLALMIFASRPLRNSLGEGQVGPLVFFVLALAMWAWGKRYSAIGGLAVTLAAAIKIFPGLVLAYFLFKRNWRAMIPSVVAGIVVFAVSLLNGGVQAWFKFFTFVLPRISIGLPNFDNQAPAGFLSRLDATPELLRDYDLLNQQEQIGVRLATIAIAIALIVLTAWWMRKYDNPNKLQTSIELGALVALMLLVVPLVWEHYLMWLIIPLFVILNALANRALTARAQVCLISAFVVSWLFLQYGPNFYALPNWPVLLMSLGLYATVLIYSSLLYLLTQRKSESANGASHAS